MNKESKNMHTVEVKYLGATNSRGSRVKLKSHRFRDSVTIPFDYELNSILDMAEVWLKENGFEPVFHGEMKDGYIIGCDLFRPLKSNNRIG